MIKPLLIASIFLFSLIVGLSYQNLLSKIEITRSTPLIFTQIKTSNNKQKKARKVVSKKKIKSEPKVVQKKKIIPKPVLRPKPKKEVIIEKVVLKQEELVTFNKDTVEQEVDIIAFSELPDIPQLLYGQSPQYPLFARENDIEDTIKLKILVNQWGKVDSSEVLEGDDQFGLVSSISSALKTWKFEPLRINGKPRAFYLIKDFEFELED